MQNYKTRRWWQRESERPWAWQWDQSIQFGSGLGLDRISKAWPMKERIDKLDAMVWMCPPPRKFISQNLTPRGMYIWDHTRAAAGDRRHHQTQGRKWHAVLENQGLASRESACLGRFPDGRVQSGLASCLLPPQGVRGQWVSAGFWIMASWSNIQPSP